MIQSFSLHKALNDTGRDKYNVNNVQCPFLRMRIRKLHIQILSLLYWYRIERVPLHNAYCQLPTDNWKKLHHVLVQILLKRWTQNLPTFMRYSHLILLNGLQLVGISLYSNSKGPVCMLRTQLCWNQFTCESN